MGTSRRLVADGARILCLILRRSSRLPDPRRLFTEMCRGDRWISLIRLTSLAGRRSYRRRVASPRQRNSSDRVYHPSTLPSPRETSSRLEDRSPSDGRETPSRRRRRQYRANRREAEAGALSADDEEGFSCLELKKGFPLVCLFVINARKEKDMRTLLVVDDETFSLKEALTVCTAEHLPSRLDIFDAVVALSHHEKMLPFLRLCFSHNVWVFAAGRASLLVAEAANCGRRRGKARIVPQTWLEATRTGMGSRSRFSHEVKMSESQTRTRPVQHPMLRDMPRIFVAKSTRRLIDPSSACTEVKVLADDEIGPQIIVYSEKVWTTRAHITAHTTKQLLRNFIDTASAEVLLDIPPKSPTNTGLFSPPVLPQSRGEEEMSEIDRHEKIKRIAQELNVGIPPLLHSSQQDSSPHSHDETGERETSRSKSPRRKENVVAAEEEVVSTKRRQPQLVIRLQSKPQRPYCGHRRFSSPNASFYSVVNDGSLYLTPYEQKQREEKSNKTRWVSRRNFSTSKKPISLREAGGVAASGPFQAASNLLYRSEDKSKFITQTGWRPIADRTLPHPPTHT